MNNVDLDLLLLREFIKRFDCCKTNGNKETFDRDKMRSLSLALRKRNIETEKIEKIAMG